MGTADRGTHKNYAAPQKKQKTKQNTPKNTVIEYSLSGKKEVYKQIKHKPVLIKSNAVKQIYCKHVVYRGYTAACVI